ncbi:MAG: hypothetical protein JWM43_1204 [Acidobacteriaceae bacterium]|nr:hypothetical protein [Acidobacteriaceae bacterium]
MRIEASTGATAVGMSSKDHARLEDAAQQFEAMLLQEMLKPMQSSENKWTADDAEVDKSADTLSAYGTEAVARAISKAGGVGIAKRVMEQVGLQSESKK